MGEWGGGERIVTEKQIKGNFTEFRTLHLQDVSALDVLASKPWFFRHLFLNLIII
jgi:hypothetical protein